MIILSFHVNKIMSVASWSLPLALQTMNLSSQLWVRKKCASHLERGLIVIDKRAFQFQFDSGRSALHSRLQNKHVQLMISRDRTLKRPWVALSWLIECCFAFHGHRFEIYA